jgi:hypothetical protein
MQELNEVIRTYQVPSAIQLSQVLGFPAEATNLIEQRLTSHPLCCD